MAISPFEFYRNYNSSDTTVYVTDFEPGTVFPSIEDARIGWTAPSGYGFKEWNSARDGTGTPGIPGDMIDESVSFKWYVIWQEIQTDTEYIATESDLTSVANAIRTKAGLSVTLEFPADFVSAIANIPTGITPTGTKQITITQNGTTTEDVTNYASASIAVNVPNSYSASDEGKVVSNGALVAQSSDTVTQNGTVDTTLINSLLVNVSGGGGGASTVKAGEFTATSVGAMSIDTGYAGTGYPLAFAIIEMGGIIPSTNVPGYSLYAKIRNDITPPSSYNFVYGFAIRCGSAGNEGQSLSSGAAIMYSLNSPMDNQNLCAVMSNAKTLRIYCGDTGTSFKTNKRYCYVVAYSDAG